ncbi:MAG: photosynthetic reaction center subunit H [Gammaproteobacteria bacterium]
METGAITEYIDVAQLVLYVFWAFFFGLIVYLRREDRREGYPLENEKGPGADPGFLFVPRPKTFVPLHGDHVVSKPDGARDTRSLAAHPAAPWPGAPLVPEGDPMQAGVGPGAWAERADVPDLTVDGAPKIVPLRAAPGFGVEARDPDPRGMTVYGCDGVAGGVVRDLWLDRADVMFRYLEVEVAAEVGAGAAAEAGGEQPLRSILLPVNFAQVDGARRRVRVLAVKGEHFAGAPVRRESDQVTLLEEERAVAYFGAGFLYADRARQEPLL